MLNTGTPPSRAPTKTLRGHPNADTLSRQQNIHNLFLWAWRIDGFSPFVLQKTACQLLFFLLYNSIGGQIIRPYLWSKYFESICSTSTLSWFCVYGVPILLKKYPSSRELTISVWKKFGISYTVLLTRYSYGPKIGWGSYV